jgi:hypothetical protein
MGLACAKQAAQNRQAKAWPVFIDFIKKFIFSKDNIFIKRYIEVLFIVNNQK